MPCEWAMDSRRKTWGWALKPWFAPRWNEMSMGIAELIVASWDAEQPCLALGPDAGLSVACDEVSQVTIQRTFGSA